MPKQQAAYGAADAPLQQSMDPIGNSPFFVQRQLNVFELFGIEGKNKYYVHQGETKDSPLVMMVREESGFCDRICCHQARAAKIFMHNGPDKSRQVLFRVDKKSYTCPAMYICRPSEADVYDHSDAKIGQLTDGCRCCAVHMDIEEKAASQQFHIHGPCQLGLLCHCCADMNFTVTDNKGKEIGKVTKLQQSFMECLCTGTTRFTVDIPDLSPEEKGLFLGATIMLDIQHFDMKAQNQGAE